MSEYDRSRSGSGGLSSLPVSFGRQMEKNGKVDCLLEHLPPKVKDFSWELQNEFSKSLNLLKKCGGDWRKVASRLGFSKIIPQLEGIDNPTIELLRECTETTTETLLRILVDVERSDVLDDILEFLNVDYPNFLAKFSTQESLNSNVSCASSLSWPLQHSGNESCLDQTGATGGRLGPQESEQAEEDFLSEESQNFWVNIVGDYEKKKWPNFVQAARNCCPTEMRQGNMEKFLCKILRIEYGRLARNDRYITLNGFLELVALFGPFKPGPDGCLQKMYDLMKQSVSRGSNRESWFAGNMDETEAANLLGNQSPGHFLIRISSSRAVEGVFVLAVKTLSGVVQIQIERDLQHNTLLLADKTFPDLMSIVAALRRDVLLVNCSQLLINPCPGLPLNALFSGYENASGRRGGRGRGKRLK